MNPQSIRFLSGASSSVCTFIFAALLAGTALAEQVIFTEVHYNPPTGEPEFIEITNNTATPFDIGTWYFSDGIDYTFPDFDPGDDDAHILQRFETILVSQVDEATLRAAYTIPAGVRVFGPYTGSLNNGGETLTLANKNGTTMATLEYRDDERWPAAADGTGHTLTRINPNLAGREWRNWAASDSPDGTPGTPTPASAGTPALVISEVHFGADGRVDWIEVHAPGSSVNASTYSLSSGLDSTVLTGNVNAGGYTSFDVDFPVESNGNLTLHLFSGGSIIDAHKFDRDNNEETFQSVPPGVEFYGGPGNTRNAANNPSARNTGIVINEIMFDAPSDQRHDEFIELYNRSAATIDLAGWRFSDGISYSFPAGTTISPGAYLVVAADIDCFSANHPGVSALGPWGGTLRDRGELLRLEDNNGNLADEVDYLPEGDWPNMADGDGATMELRHPDMDNNVATAWADSDESQKTTMQPFSYTADFDRAEWNPVTSGQELHTHLVGDSHIILENISIRENGAGANLLDNPSVMSPNTNSASGWVTQGTHWASFFDGTQLNLIADGHGDNKGNRGEVDIDTMTVGTSYTLDFEARWVSGKSRIIFQTLDHAFGTTFLIPVPGNLGTPGAANSALIASAAPTVSGVVHSPAVPDTNDTVTVTAQVESSAALSSVELVYRLDSNSGNATWLRKTMADTGSGLYSTTLNQYRNQANIVEFYVEAKSGTASTFQPRFGPGRPAMWIVDGRTMPDSFLRERFIISENDRRALTTSIGGGAEFAYNFPRPSNHFFNATFIANESEVFYNAEIRKSGSPFTRATNANIDHGKWKLPGDRLFRGRRRSVIDASGTNEGSNTPRFYDDRMARYFLYQLGHPVNEMEFVHTAVNGLGFKVREDQEPISNDMLNRNFEDGSDGTLLRIDDEWRFDDSGAPAGGNGSGSRNADWSYKDSNNPVRYHSEWLMRTRENDYDYGNFIEFTRTLEEDTYDYDTINRLADIDMLALNAAVRGYDADWDTITVNRGKNAYMFRPKDGNGWMLLHWDGDRVFERTTQAIIGNRANVGDFFNKPFVKRQVNYYLTKLLDEHTRNSARTEAWMQAEEDAVAGTPIATGGTGIQTSAIVSNTMNHYRNWFTVRETTARNYVTNAVSTTAFSVSTSNAATAAHTIDLAGKAPPEIHTVRVSGQDGNPLEWVNTTDWTLGGVQLKSGANNLTIEGLDHEGNIVDTVAFNITKTSNAPPVVVISTSPKSGNVNLNETLTLDANASYDPDGGALSFSWSVDPGVFLEPSADGTTATVSFTQPGAYIITVTATDPNSQNTIREIPIAAYGSTNFSTFGTDSLEEFYSFSGVNKHANASSSAFYSLQDNPGRLTINIPVTEEVPPNPLAMVIDWDATWSYNDSGNDLVGIFQAPAFDDSAWPTAPAFLGFGGISAGYPDPPGYQTNTLTRGYVTYYFRKEFQFTGEVTGSSISIDHVVDDGVRYFLNGQELGRVRLPEGAIDFETVAAQSNEGVIEEAVVRTGTTSSLVVGTNVLAAEVHNQSAGSSDLFFGARVSVAEGTGVPSAEDAIPAWINRPLPASGDWVLQTEVKLEKSQFSNALAGLLVGAVENGTPTQYSLAFDNGIDLTAARDGAELASTPLVASDLAILRIERAGDNLIFYWHDGTGFSQIHQAALPAGTTFTDGGVFASVSDAEDSIEASFDYLMLIDPSTVSNSQLVVSEIMYHPAGAGESEFIELFNAGDTPIELDGFQTIPTEPFDGFTFPTYTIQPGAYALLVSDEVAFTAQYGAELAPKVIAEWPGGSLKNSGEPISLTDGAGSTITSFSYDDEAPWPLTPDGMGPSLVINDERGGLDPNIGTNWRASLEDGGSPGRPDTDGTPFENWLDANGFTDPDAEYAGTGLTNLIAYALGRDLGSSVAPTLADSSGFAGLSFRQRTGDPNLVYSIESSPDLDIWSPATDMIQAGAPVDNGDGTQLLNFISNVPTSGRPDTFYRLRVTLP